jgi:LPXTG-site transpeptidase (sortase) family protein
MQIKKEGFLGLIKSRKWSFLLNFSIVLFITFGFLYFMGFVPEEFKMSYGRYPENNISQKENAEIPLVIKIPSINVDVEVYNPQTTSTEVLDSFLAKGAVHYPGSGNLGYGNIFIFGHNTRLAVVNNQGFKAFNGLRDLKEGDLINVYSGKSIFSYKITSVKLEGADKALVVFNTQVHKLTLSTCDTFGAKSDRYVVEAEYIIKETI